MNKQLYLISIIVALIAVIGTVFWLGLSPKQSLVTDDSLSTTPDYFVVDINVNVFDASGQIIENIQADDLKHYNNRETSLLIKPSIVRTQGLLYWSAKGDKGVLEDGSQDIVLEGHGEVIRTLQSGESMHLTADQIHYNDAQQHLVSAGNAKLTSKQGITVADKIIADIKTERVSLTGNVRGFYETN